MYNGSVSRCIFTKNNHQNRCINTNFAGALPTKVGHTVVQCV